jgi:hypothetical protein
MAYRHPHAAPQSQIPEERQGRTVGRFCKVCGSIYSLLRTQHRGRAVYGRDHIASPCSHEGDTFEAGATWWEPAVEVLPEAVEKAATDFVVGSPAKGTGP